jgi:ribosomal protein S18 acetylase RimI-like enzyme
MATIAADAPDTAEIEAAFVTAWPALKTVMDGYWLWRFAHGYTKRANSIQSHRKDDEARVGERLERLSALSAAHGIEPLFRVTPLTGEGVVSALDAGAWQSFEESHVLTRALDAPLDMPAGVTLLAPTDAVWIAEQVRLSGYGPQTAETLDGMLELIAVPSAGILLADAHGQTVAAALAVQTGRIGVYLNVIVDKERRGEGWGRKVMESALAWTRGAGATHAAIQVLANNAAALGLYRSLGFVDAYSYDYRRRST